MVTVAGLGGASILTNYLLASWVQYRNIWHVSCTLLFRMVDVAQQCDAVMSARFVLFRTVWNGRALTRAS